MDIILIPSCRNLIEKPWPYNPNILGFISRTQIKTQGFLTLDVWPSCTVTSTQTAICRSVGIFCQATRAVFGR